MSQLEVYLEAVGLGIIQGISEFLPISSSGHLVIVSEVIHQLTGRQVDPESNLQMTVALHLGTLLSILVVYRRDLRNLIRQPRLCLAIVAATIPIVIVGFTLKDAIKTHLFNPLAAGCGLWLTAGLLFCGQRADRDELSLPSVGWKRSVVIGLFQAVAIVPGVSRSGSTIAGGLIVGLRRDAATTFSFLIAIPAIAGAVVLTAKDIFEGQGGDNSLGVLAVGAFVSFVIGFFALRWLIRLVSQRKLHWFAWYCLCAGTAAVLWQLIT